MILLRVSINDPKDAQPAGKKAKGTKIIKISSDIEIDAACSRGIDLRCAQWFGTNHCWHYVETFFRNHCSSSAPTQRRHATQYLEKVVWTRFPRKQAKAGSTIMTVPTFMARNTKGQSAHPGILPDAPIA